MQINLHKSGVTICLNLNLIQEKTNKQASNQDSKRFNFEIKKRKIDMRRMDLKNTQKPKRVPITVASHKKPFFCEKLDSLYTVYTFTSSQREEILACIYLLLYCNYL